MGLPGLAKRYRGAGALFGLFLLAIAASGLALTTVRRRDDGLTTLPGSVRPDLATATDRGPVDPSTVLSLTVALRPTSMAALAAAVNQAQAANVGCQVSGDGCPGDPRPDTGHLTPDALNHRFAFDRVREIDRSGFVTGTDQRRFGRSDAEIDDLTQYFRTYGLTVPRVAADGLSVRVTGRADQIEQALSTSFHYFDSTRGERYYAATRDPALPSNIAAIVATIFGLDDYPALRPQYLRTGGRSDSTGLARSAVTIGGYVPSDIATAYGIGTLHAIGATGTSQTIGIIGCSAFSQSDVNAFAWRFGLPPASMTTILVDGGGSSPDAETTLDLEWSHAAAPGASLRVYDTQSLGGGCTYQGFYDAINAAVSDNIANLISISVVTCEADYGGYRDQIDVQLALAALNSQSVFVASGDNGAYACVDGFGHPSVGVDYPSSSAYVTAVGGTTLSLNPDSSYQNEVAWGSSAETCGSTACGSGGGVSSYFAKPVWQSSASANTTLNRGVPDVALDSDPATGYVVYYNGSLDTGYGGTSFGAPIWAGIAALIDQANGGRVGLLSPILYGPTVLDAQSSENPPFHDVVSGNNLLYDAGPGWDFATGWGSPDAYNLVRAIVPAVAQTPTATATTTPTVTSTPTLTPVPTDSPFRVYLPLVPFGIVAPPPTSEASPTNSATATATATPTLTPTRTPSWTSTSTTSPTPTLTATATPTLLLTLTFTASPTISTSDTPTTTTTQTTSATHTPTMSPTVTPSGTATPTTTPTPL
jgi:kumamolisin